jgi:hypothetical protein
MFHLIVKDSMYVYVYYVNVVWKKSNTPELDRLDVADCKRQAVQGV